MTVELAHDIIALKIWEQLPEQDKQLRLIRHSLAQRLTDYQRGAGSLLGEKELLAWEDYFDLIQLSSPLVAYIQNSKEAVHNAKIVKKAQQERELKLAQQKLNLERQARKRQRSYMILFGVLAIISVMASVLAWQKSRDAQANRQIADKNEAIAINQKNEANNKRKEAEVMASQFGKAAKKLTLKISKELFEVTELAKNNYDYQLLLDKAKEVKATIATHRAEIQTTTNDKIILQEFNHALNKEEQKADKLIKNYEESIINGSAQKYARLMRKINKAIQLEKFEIALQQLSIAQKLNFSLKKPDIKQRKIQVKNLAFDYYSQKARNDFKDNHSKRGKYIHPHQFYKKAKKYGNNLQNSTMDNWFKNSFCKALVIEYDQEKYQAINTIVQICKNE